MLEELDQNTERTVCDQRRQKWISAIKRDRLTDSILKCEKVCSKHFIHGKPADLKDVDNPDWVPNQNMGYISGPHLLKRKTDLEKSKQVEKRRKIMDTQPPAQPVGEDDIPAQKNLELPLKYVAQTQKETGVASQADFSFLELNNQLLFAHKTIQKLSAKVEKRQLTYSILKEDNTKCHYYTGLDFPILEIVFEEIKEFIPSTSVTALEPFQQVLLAFMKLRLDFPFKDLGYRFGISSTTCSSYFNVIVDIMYKRFKSLIIWPDKEQIHVEKIIESIKSKFQILKGSIPMSCHTSHTANTDLNVLDKIVVVCRAMNNICR